MRKITSTHYGALLIFLCTTFLFSACKKDNKSDPEPAPEDERITLVKKWAGKWASQDLTHINPKIEYFDKSRNTKEMIYGEKEFTLERARSLDTLVMRYEVRPSAPPTNGELPNLKAYSFFKEYPNVTFDRLNLEITPSTDSKTKGTIVVKQTFAGMGLGESTPTNPFGDGSFDIWRLTFTVPR